MKAAAPKGKKAFLKRCSAQEIQDLGSDSKVSSPGLRSGKGGRTGRAGIAQAEKRSQNFEGSW